ncbi:Cytokinin riboside 5'-monophosphate phosphoribohydrolase LOG4 [Dendrobium catenatum]|uniref:cytokinin riboside 5'-monophosphate phosphoribohydrolase n=1 Tax=Dendrobium catenatum TaxID=906689 RepID=A0A2I0XFA2_9ASPA|nr:Cytokinin riboside 5'-monophosphate phosphoribohydrolase LOG4 [Dendrobium catenatum]
MDRSHKAKEVRHQLAAVQKFSVSWWPGKKPTLIDSQVEVWQRVRISATGRSPRSDKNPVTSGCLTSGKNPIVSIGSDTGRSSTLVGGWAELWLQLAFGQNSDIGRLSSGSPAVVEKPVGLFNVDGYYNSLLSFVDMAVMEAFISQKARHIIVSSPTTNELVKKLEEYVPFTSSLYLHVVSSPENRELEGWNIQDLILGRKSV